MPELEFLGARSQKPRAGLLNWEPLNARGEK
jgi:hypothetical protein